MLVMPFVSSFSVIAQTTTTHSIDQTIGTATNNVRHVIDTNGVTLTVNANTTGINNNGIQLSPGVQNGTVVVEPGVTVSTNRQAIDATDTTNTTVINSGTIFAAVAKTIELEGTNSGATITNNAGGVITGLRNSIKLSNTTTNTTINNSGTISITDTGVAIGPGAGNDTGTIINNNPGGLILVTASGTGALAAIEMGDSGTLTNSGEIRNDSSPSALAISVNGDDNTIILKDGGIIVGVLKADPGTTGNKIQLQHGFGRAYFYDTEGDFTLEDLDGNTVIKGSAGSVGLGAQETVDELLSLRSATIRAAIKSFAAAPKLNGTGVIWGETFAYASERNNSGTLLKYDTYAYGANFIQPLSSNLNFILSFEQNKLDLQEDHNVTRRGFLTGFNVPKFISFGNEALTAGGFAVAGVGWYDSRREILTNTTTSGQLVLDSNYRSLDLIAGGHVAYKYEPSKVLTSLGELTNKWVTEIGLTFGRSHTGDYNEGQLFFWEDRDLVQGSLHLEKQYSSQLNERLGLTLGAELKHRKVLTGKEQTYKIKDAQVVSGDGNFSENSVSGNIGLNYSTPFGLAFVHLKGQLLSKARSAFGGGIGIKVHF